MYDICVNVPAESSYVRMLKKCETQYANSLSIVDFGGHGSTQVVISIASYVLAFMISYVPVLMISIAS